MKAYIGELGENKSSNNNDHIAEQHTEPKLGQYECKHCDRPFQTMDAFKRHLTSKHGVKFHD